MMSGLHQAGSLDTSLHAACPNCGATNRVNARFCDECGKPLAQATSDSNDSDIQLRHATILFCDLR
jgi:predicted amidophosphoribosyltransferase